MQRLPEKLRILRDRHHMTQQEVADTLGIGRVFVHKLESGKKKPNVEMLVKIADLFGVTTDQLVRDELEV